MGVLAMLELEGETRDLMTASEKLEALLPTPDGLLARIVAPTDDGMVLFQLWDSADARRLHAEDPAHAEALSSSGMRSLVRGSRSRAFGGAVLRRLTLPEA